MQKIFIISLLLGTPAFADVVLKDMTGKVKTVTSEALSKNCERHERDQDLEMNTRYENFDDSVSFLNPRVKYAGKYIPILNEHNTHAGYCKSQGKKKVHFSKNVGANPEQLQVAYLDREGKIAGTEKVHDQMTIVKILTCID